MVWKVRRVITGHNKEGRSMFLQDGHAPNVKEMASMPGLALTDLWETLEAPASNEGDRDAATRPVRLEPPSKGTILRIVEFPPDSAWRDKADAMAAFDSIGAGHAKDKHNADPMMHKTSTVDYIIVLSGEIYAIMEEGETLLKPGDILIQRGTNHSWSVRGTEPCIVAAVLVGSRPIGSKAAKKPAVKKAAAKKAASKQAGSKKAASKKAAAKKGVSRKAPAKKAAAKKPAVKKAARKAAPRKAAKKATGKKAKK
jgi:mannose-6-phosphate isomerase-like protein (cupin superfamily)